ncbi:MAG TPA: Gfo/Idh/MocA family oxidoreductase, partial [Roseiflexaceae bacterium]
SKTTLDSGATALPTRSYRAGVIGHTGRGGFSHGLDVAFAGLPGVGIVAVADPDEDGRRRCVEKTSTGAESPPRGYADYREMLAREALDLVAVAPTDLDQREVMVTAAAEAGVRAIYCEKPLAQSLEQADRMLAACDARGVKIAVAHQNRSFPAPRLVQRLIAGGKIGRLRRLRAWPKQDSRGGGLELLIHGTHMFDLMRLFAGDGRWCHGRVIAGGRDATAHDAHQGQYATGLIAGDDISAEYGFDSGVVGEFESMVSDDGGGSEYLHMEVSGSAGTLAFWSEIGSPVYFTLRPYALPDVWDEWERIQPEPVAVPTGFSRLHPGNQALVRDLLAAVEEDRAPDSSGHDARAALEMVLAAYESHRQGKRVTLPLAERAHPLERWMAETAT